MEDHKGQRLVEAGAGYRQVLQRQPQSDSAVANLGLLLIQSRQQEQAKILWQAFLLKHDNPRIKSLLRQFFSPDAPATS